MFWDYFATLRRSSALASESQATHIAATLRRNRHALAVQLMENVAGWEKYARRISEHQTDLDSYIKLEFYVFIDYLQLYLSTGDTTYKNLYISEKLKQLHDPSLTFEQDDDTRHWVTEGDIKVLCGHVRVEMGPEEAAMLEVLLREIQKVVTAHGRKELSILLIGDCVYLDVRGFLAPLSLEDGITFRPTFITSKNPIEQRNALRRMADQQQFNVIFYSPFTYEFALALDRAA